MNDRSARYVATLIIGTLALLGASIGMGSAALAAPVTGKAITHAPALPQTSTLYVGESSTQTLGLPPESGGIGLFDPTDLASGPSAVLPAIPAPAGDNGYASVVLVGTTLVGLDGGGQVLRRFNTLTGTSADQTITGPSAIGPVFGLAASPDGTTLYLVGIENGALQISAMNASTWTVTTTYEVPGSGAAGTSSFVTVDPATGDLWISDNGVLVVDPSDWTTRAVFAGQHTGQVAIDGSDAWLPVGSSLLEVSTSDFTTVRSIATGGPLSTVSAAPDGSRIYATYAVPTMGNFEYYLAAVDATTGVSDYTVLVGASDEDGRVITTVSPDGSTVFIATGFIGSGAPPAVTGYVRTIDTGTGTLTGDGVQTNQPVTSLVLDPNPPIPTQGYWQVAADGGVFSFGNAAFYGSMGGLPLNQPIVGITAGPDDQGYWEVASDGGLFSFGDAVFYGSMGGHPLNEPIVGIATTPDRQGYWEVARDGGIFSFGDAVFYGSMGGHPLNQPIVGIAGTSDGHGYWEVASDGGIFAFGDAAFYGSMGGHLLNEPIVGIAATPDGKGYWLVAADGGIFAYGDATFHGSAGGTHLNQPIVGIAATPDGDGYWLVAADGGLFAYGDATFYGSTGGTPLNRPVVGIGATGQLTSTGAGPASRRG